MACLTGLTTVAIILLCLAPATAPAQSDTLVRPLSETTVPDSVTNLQDVRREPRKALLWAAIPGGGQVFNKRWWKVPLVYSGLLGMVAYAEFNQTYYDRLTRALENRCLGEGDIIAECETVEDEFDPLRVSNDALLRERRNADRARQTAYIGIFAVYLLQAVEAYTDAHLQEFDISDDLSIRLGPVAQPGGSLAMGLIVPLGQGRKQQRAERTVARLQAQSR